VQVHVHVISLAYSELDNSIVASCGAPCMFIMPAIEGDTGCSSYDEHEFEMEDASTSIVQCASGVHGESRVQSGSKVQSESKVHASLALYESKVHPFPAPLADEPDEGRFMAASACHTFPLTEAAALWNCIGELDGMLWVPSLRI